MTHLFSASALRRGGFAVLVCLMLLAGCGKQQATTPALQGVPAASASSGKAHGNSAFGLTSAGAQVRDQQTALVLRFNAPLAAAQMFDSQIAVTGPNGEAVSGSWSLDDDNKTLRFPFVRPDQHYAVLLRAKLLAADGRTLGHDEDRKST